MQRLGIWMAAAIATATGGVKASEVVYDVSFPEARNHYAQVRMSFDAVAGANELMLPVWTPGSYLIREYARHLDSISAAADDGSPLDIEKTSKNRWRLEAPSAGRVVVAYRLYCRELSVRTNWVEESFALLNGAATYLTPAAARESPHVVRLHPIDAWPQSVCALPRHGSAAHGYRAADYDQLVDSPIVLGDLDVHAFDVGGKEHLLVNVGEGGLWNGAQAAADVARVVAEHQRMWRVVPYERYVFFNVAAESRGGLEHDDCTVLMTSRWAYRDPEAYQAWQGLASHEFFHAWNVRRLRPQGLMRYDYERENYFPELWIAEGVTSYYDDLALARCGLIDRDQYLKLLSKQIETLQTTPGRGVQSLPESSHDAWIKFYRRDENSGNTQISYYNKGAVAAFLLDAEIRRRTAGAKSLDDVLPVFYERFVDVGYTENDFRELVAEIVGEPLDDWFDATIDGAGELHYEAALDWFGLQFAAQEAGPGEDPQGDAAWLGVSTRLEAGRQYAATVTAGGPAAAAGVNAEDELVAINGFRVAPEGIAERLKQYAPGDEIRLLVARRQELLEREVVLGASGSGRWTLQVAPEATDEQAERLAAWLHAAANE